MWLGITEVNKIEEGFMEEADIYELVAQNEVRLFVPRALVGKWRAFGSPEDVPEDVAS